MASGAALLNGLHRLSGQHLAERSLLKVKGQGPLRHVTAQAREILDAVRQGRLPAAAVTCYSHLKRLCEEIAKRLGLAVVLDHTGGGFIAVFVPVDGGLTGAQVEHADFQHNDQPPYAFRLVITVYGQARTVVVAQGGEKVHIPMSGMEGAYIMSGALGCADEVRGGWG